MISIKNIATNEWITFREFNLKLDGLIVIRGINKHSASDNSSNRSGKSAIVGSIAKCLFDSVPQPVKGPRKAKHALRKGTSLRLDIRVNQNNYRIEKYFDRTARVRILEGKNNRGIRLKKTGDAAISEIFPLNEAQFYASVYIDARRPSQLQYGTDADRFKFFEHLFDLDIYRKLNEQLKADAQINQRLQVQRETLQQQLDDLGQTPLKDHSLQYKRLKSRYDLKKQKVVMAQKYLHKLELYHTALTTVPTGFADDSDDLRAKMQDLSQRIDQATKQEEQQRLYRKTEEQRQILTKAIKDTAIDIDRDYPSHVQSLRDKQNIQEKAKEQYQLAYKEYRAKLLECTLDIEDGLKNTSISKIEQNLDKTRSRIDFMTRLKTVLDHDPDDHKTCPVCASVFEEDQHKEFQDRIAKSLKQAKVKARTLRDALSWHVWNKQVQELKNNLKKPDYDESLNLEIEKAETNLDLMRKKADLIRKLRALPKIDKPKLIEDISRLRAQNADYLQRLQRAERVAQAKQLIEKLNLNLSLQNTQTKIQYLKDQLPEQEAFLASQETTLTGLLNLMQEQKTHAIQQQALQSEIDSLDQKLSNKPVDDALRIAFGSKGLVKQKTQALAQAFEKALNEGATLVYDEPITFRLDVTDTKFGIYATRNNLEDDVRSLSGQESRAFSLIIMLSLLRFMPSHLRCDLAVLDEAEALLDEPSRRMLVDKFIPELQRFVKTVLIVTPLSRSEFYIPNCSEYVAKKEGGVSQLIPFEKLAEA